MAAPTSVVRIAIKAIDQTKAGFTTPIRNAKDLAASLKKLGPAAAVAGAAVAAGFTATAKKLIDLRQEMAEFSDRIGIATEDLSRLKFAAEQNGVSFDTLKTSLQAMTRRIGDAADGSGAAAASLEKMGLNAAELSKLSPEDQFRAIAQGFDRLETSSERADAAQQIFSRSGVQMLQILAGGSDGLARMTAQADALGLTITNNTARAVQGLNEKLGSLQGSLDGIVNQFLEGFLPALKDLGGGPSGLQRLAKALGDRTAQIINAVNFLVKSFVIIYDLVVDYFSFIATKSKEFFNIIGQILKSVGQSIANWVLGLVRSLIDKMQSALAAVPEFAKKALGLSGVEGQLVNLKSSFNDAFSPEVIKQTNEQISKSLESYKSDWVTWAGMAKEDLAKIGEMFNKLGQTPPPPAPRPKPKEDPETVVTSSPFTNFLPAPMPSVAGLPSQETLQQFAQNYLEAMNNIQAIGIETFTGIESAMSSAFAGIIDGTMSAKEAFKAMGQNMLSVIASIIARLIVANLLVKALGFGGGGGGGIFGLFGLGGGGGLPASSIANPANIGGLDIAPAFEGMIHGGMTYVPKESTYLLDEGERVLSPRQNADLIEFMEASGTRPVNIMLDGSVLAKTITNLSDRGLIEIRPSVVI